jgi:uncharacterized small protein (DUF1192 family)
MSSPAIDLVETPALVTKRRTLVEIVDELDSLARMEESLEAEEPSPENQEQIALLQEEKRARLEAELAKGSDVVEWYLRKRYAAVADLQDEITAMERKIGRINAQIARDRNSILSTMKAYGITLIKGMVSSISLIQPKKKKLDPFNEAIIPIEYYQRITSLVLDKAKVQEDLEKNIPVPGAELRDAEPHIMIRGPKPKRLKE